MRPSATMVKSSDFVAVDYKEMNLQNLEIAKEKKIYKIHIDGKRLWIKCANPVPVKWGYSVKDFKGDGKVKKGSFVISVNSDLKEAIESVDSFVFSEFDRMFSGTIIDNIMMTKNTVNRMFKNSLYDGGLRLNVAGDTCAFFSKERELSDGMSSLEKVKSNVAVAVVIEPAFAWVFNKQIGIHWDARQVRFDGFARSFDELSVESSDDGAADDEKMNVAFNIHDDSDDERPRPPEEKTLKRKKVQSSLWSIGKDSDSDDAPVRVKSKGKVSGDKKRTEKTGWSLTKDSDSEEQTTVKKKNGIKTKSKESKKGDAVESWALKKDSDTDEIPVQKAPPLSKKIKVNKGKVEASPSWNLRRDSSSDDMPVPVKLPKIVKKKKVPLQP